MQWMVKTTPHRTLYVVDHEQRLMGVVRLEDSHAQLAALEQLMVSLRTKRPWYLPMMKWRSCCHYSAIIQIALPSPWLRREIDGKGYRNPLVTKVGGIFRWLSCRRMCGKTELPPDFPSALKPMMRIFQLVGGLSAAMNIDRRYDRRYRLAIYTGEVIPLPKD